jgi:hypothetical protein
MASGERATQGFRDSRNEQRWPNNSQGWGRPLLDNVLYFPGDVKKTISIDQTEGLITGDVVTYNFTVNSNAVPLRVMLVWSDYPGTVGAGSVLVNDLNLDQAWRSFRCHQPNRGCSSVVSRGWNVQREDFGGERPTGTAAVRTRDKRGH